MLGLEVSGAAIVYMAGGVNRKQKDEEERDERRKRINKR